jgi:predicted PurR-regulated permease PerM
MLGLAVIVAIGGFLTIGFAYWVTRQAVPVSAKEAKTALAQVRKATTVLSARQDQLRTAIQDPNNDPARSSLQAALDTHNQAVTNLTAVDDILKEILGSLGGIFQGLAGLSPPIAALCVAVLMFLTAGGIEVANKLIH